MGKMIHKPGKDRGPFEKAMRSLPGIRSKIGWFESAQYTVDGKNTPVAYIAAIQDNGVASQSIPPRPFFRPTQERQRSAWSDLMARLAKRVVKGAMSAHDAMETIGLQAEADVRKTITEITEPPLSILTLMARKRRLEGGRVTGKTIGEFAAEVKAKGAENVDVSGVSTKPLNETGQMLATLTSVTESKS